MADFVEDDEVIREMDVYVTDAAIDLYLLQFPLKPIYADTPNVSVARFKPTHKKLEIEVPYPEAMASDGQVASNQNSSVVARNANLAVGVIRENALHITALDEVLQIRPSFKTLHTSNWESVEDISDDEEHDGIKNEKPVEQVHMKRRETDKAQSARAQSFTHVQAQEENEPYQRLSVYPVGSAESDEGFEQIYYFPGDQ